MSGYRQKAVREIYNPLAALLPAERPGLTAKAAHAALATSWAPNTIRIALDVLERDGIAMSELVPGRTEQRGQPTRFFRRASAITAA